MSATKNAPPLGGGVSDPSCCSPRGGQSISWVRHLMRGQAIAEPGLATNPAMMAREGAGLCLPSVPERAAGKVSSRLGTLRPTWRGASGDRFPEPLCCTRWPPMSWAGWGRLGAQIGDKGQPVSQAQRGVTMFRKRGPRNTHSFAPSRGPDGWLGSPALPRRVHPPCLGLAAVTEGQRMAEL